MRYDSLRSPISETDPCGPDLDEIGDGDYANYMLLASSRLPAKFYSVRETGEEAPFDRKSIDLDDELEAIGGFLKRSRDVRLLTLEARFQILTGSLIGFSEAVQGIAILVSEFWEKFLPLPYEGDQMLRQNTVEGLDDPIQILLPLQYATLVAGGGSLPAVTYRNYTVASGKAKARPGEEAYPLGDLDKTLSDSSTAARAGEAHEAILAAIAALRLIRETFIAKAGHEFAPNYDRLTGLLAEMDEVITSHRPELAPAKPVTAEDSAEGEAGEPQAETAPSAVAVKSHEAARTALLAVEGYFRRTEPSSPAFILVHQATRLIGKPLVEAMAALLPSDAKAVLRMNGTYEFDIDLNRMKAITEDALSAPLPDLPAEEPSAPAPVAGPVAAEPTADGAAAATGEAADGSGGEGASAANGAEPAPAPPAAATHGGAPPVSVYVARTRADAAGLMLGAEAFFRKVEPSSPIPLLLEKGRGYLNRDFASIMNELAPPKKPG
jgi:type VI secretion system protein ImpA